MRSKFDGKECPAIWSHPALDGQLVSALTRKEAFFLVLAITKKEITIENFTRTGVFAHRSAMISTISAFEQFRVKMDVAEYTREQTDSYEKKVVKTRNLLTENY